MTPRPLRALLARRRRDPVMILPYAGYGTRSRAVVCGRVLEDEGFRPAAAGERRWRNLVAFVKRMESDEVPYARLIIGRQEVRCDREGYFRAELPGPFRAGWNEVLVRLAADVRVHAGAPVLVPSPAARFGVVSDIDDTVVRSDVTRKVRMLVGIALANARTRKPFPGVAAFYRALHAGANPIFYVSKSPWNLYAPLVEYLEAQRLPAGPLLLRDFGWRMPKAHKERAIAAILETYPRLPFVLVGDSGERDPEIYAGIVRRFPRRIRAIYIRSVDLDAKRIMGVRILARTLAATGCQLVLAPRTETAAAHAAAEGLIAADDLSRVRADCAADGNAAKRGA
jgi:phosphatidate phosphatase APP1